MLPKNKGITENEILQNQFTAYVSRAIHNRRLRYLVSLDRRCKRELPFSQHQDWLAAEDNHMDDIWEYELLRQLLRQIRDKERAIVLARIVDEKSFAEISQEMNMSYKAVTNLYYRVMKRLKKHMEGVDTDEF